MNIHDMISTEIAYVAQFSTITRTTDYLIAKDELQIDKYFHNFMMIHSDDVSEDALKLYESKQKKEGFVIFRFEEKNSQTFSLLRNYQLETYGYFHAKIDSLHISSAISCSIERVNPYKDDKFFEFLFNEDLPYGEDYARNNVLRQRMVLQEYSNNYFYLKLVLDGEIIGDINACLQSHVAKIDDFNIMEKHQRKGYGSALMRSMIEVLKGEVYRMSIWSLTWMIPQRTSMFAWDLITCPLTVSTSSHFPKNKQTFAS